MEQNYQRIRPQPPQPQAAPAAEETAIMAHLARLERKFDTIVPGAMRALPSPDVVDPIDQFEAQLKPANKAISLAKWVLGITVPIFLTGAAWQKWGDTLATQSDIQAHIDDDFKPMQAQVSVVNSNVGQLLREAKRDREIANLERRVDSYQAVFDARMDKYHGSRARWPDKYFREPEANDKLATAKIELREALERPTPGGSQATPSGR